MKKRLLITTAVLSSVILTIAMIYYVKIRPRVIMAEYIGCRSKLLQIGLLARLWADDNWTTNHIRTSGKITPLFPTNFQFLMEATKSSKILICPSDSSNPLRQAEDWTEFEPAKASYELVSPGMMDGDVGTVFMRCKIHDLQLKGDGHVY